MSSDNDFDDEAYKAFEDQLYEEESLSGTDDDLDSEVEEVLYSQVHYASALAVSKNSTPGNKTPKAGFVEDSILVAQGQKCHLDSSVIEISSDDDDDNNDNDDESIDNHGDVHHSSSFNYPEVVFCDENISATVEGASKESSVVQNKEESGKTAENWDLDERDLQDSKTTNQRSRYYTPGKGLSHVKCYNCNEKGHLSQNCPQPKKISVCFLCGGVGHVKRYCPNELCFNCCEPGHISKQCRKPRRRAYDRCNRCHVLGHIANDCPDRWRQFHLTTEVGPVVRPDRPVSRTSPVYCYNCGHQGHYGHECQEENVSMRSELPWPFVVYYDGWGQMSSSRQKNKHKKQTPNHRSKDKQQYQAMSQGFYDQARPQDYDVDCRLFQPPPEKIRKTDDSSERRVSFHDDSYETSAFNLPYADRTPKMDNNRDKRKKETERCEECQEENASMRSELPLPLAAHYDDWGQMSSFREKTNHKKQTPKPRSKDKKQYQAMSQGFYDQPRQQDYDMDWRLSQPPPKKIRKTDDSDVRVSFHVDSYETSAFNSPYPDATPKVDNNRNKTNKCQMSSSRQKNKHKKQTPKPRSKDKQQYQALSQGFYDQARPQDYDVDCRLFQPPPEKIRKTDDSSERRVSFRDDSYETSAFNLPYADRTPKMDNNRDKRKKETERCERIVEILEPSPSHDGLIEEPYVFKRKKAKKRGKQRRQGGERSDNNFHGVNFNARNSSKQHSERRSSNPQRKDVYRSLEDRQFNSKITSSYPRKENNKFTSNRGFQFNNESRRKTYLKRYTF